MVGSHSAANSSKRALLTGRLLAPWPFQWTTRSSARRGHKHHGHVTKCSAPISRPGTILSPDPQHQRAASNTSWQGPRLANAVAMDITAEEGSSSHAFKPLKHHRTFSGHRTCHLRCCTLQAGFGLDRDRGGSAAATAHGPTTCRCGRNHAHMRGRCTRHQCVSRALAFETCQPQEAQQGGATVGTAKCAAHQVRRPAWPLHAQVGFARRCATALLCTLSPCDDGVEDTGEEVAGVRCIEDL